MNKKFFLSLLIFPGISFYLAPTLYAYLNGKDYLKILLINLFFGWTCVGWAYAWVLSFEGKKTKVIGSHEN